MGVYDICRALTPQRQIAALRQAEVSQSRRGHQSGTKREKDMSATRSVRTLSLAVLLATLAASALAAPPPHPNPGIIPPNAHYGGLTYGEWLAGLNQWIFAVSAADNL